MSNTGHSSKDIRSNNACGKTIKPMSEQEKDYPMYEVSESGIKQVSCSACQSLRTRIEGLKVFYETGRLEWGVESLRERMIKDLNSLLGEEKPKPERQVE